MKTGGPESGRLSLCWSGSGDGDACQHIHYYKINKAFGWAEYSDKNNRKPIELYVETCNGKIRFCSTKAYTIDFDDVVAANWLGFTSSQLVLNNTLFVSYAKETKDANGLIQKSYIVDANKICSGTLNNAFNVSIGLTGYTAPHFISFEEKCFENVTSNVDVAAIIQNKINDSNLTNYIWCKILF